MVDISIAYIHWEYFEHTNESINLFVPPIWPLFHINDIRGALTGVCFTKKYVRTVLTYCYSATVRGYELYVQTNMRQTWDCQIL